MNWSDKSFLLSKYKYQENSVIANFYTMNYGKRSGIIYGATSKKIKNYLQNGNELFIEYHSKNENTLGYFKIEIIQATTPKYFTDKKKLNCIVNMLDLIRLLTVDNQENIEIYNLIKNFYLIIDHKDFYKKYIFWELELLKLIGFDLKIKDYCKKEKVNNKDNYYISKNNIKLIVPDFLVNLKNEKIADKDIYYSLLLISEYMKTNILIPNNIPFPISREVFINEFK